MNPLLFEVLLVAGYAVDFAAAFSLGYALGKRRRPPRRTRVVLPRRR